MTDKEKILAKIKSLLNETNYEPFTDEVLGKICACKSLLSFIDTLEEKDVDLDDSATHYLLHKHTSPLSAIMHQADLKAEMQYHKDIKDAYKAGFELGLKTKEK